MKTLLMRSVVLILFVVFAVAAKANPYIVVDVETGRVLAHKDAFDRWYPASLTKMMTAYVTFRAMQRGEVNPNTRVTLSAASSKLAPSRSGYRVGSVLTLDNALKILMVKSANDVAMSIGETISGNATTFVTRMNQEAQRIGMFGTHFSNTNGLPDPDNYSTARDLAVLAAQIRREFPQYAFYFNIEAIDFGDGRKIQLNSNNLIGRYEGADGMKTGFICASGFNLTASATRAGRTIIAVVLGADRIDAREGLAADLLTAGFKSRGSAQLTLANMRPYGTKLTQVTNLREDICNEAAWQVRMQYRDEKGKTIFNSPFIGALKPNPRVVPIQLLYTPPAPPPAAKKQSTGAKQGSNTKRKTPVPSQHPARR